MHENEKIILLKKIMLLKRDLRNQEVAHRKAMASLFIIFIAAVLLFVGAVIFLNHKYNETKAMLNQKEEQIEFLERTPTVDIGVLDKIEKLRYVVDAGISTDLILYADEQCREWNLHPQFLWAVVELESKFDPNADNLAGSSARGLGQILKGTGKYLWEDILGNPKGSYYHDMAYDPYVNIQLMCCHLGSSFNRGCLLNEAVKAYSGGTSGYMEKLMNIATSHGYDLSDVTCRYPQEG